MNWELFLNAFMFCDDEKDAHLAQTILERMGETILVKKTTERVTEFLLFSGSIVYIDPKGMYANYPYEKRDEVLLRIKKQTT